ncbi:alpha/beta hydrolase [Candidatus Thioglobus sp.]|nr:alpha/beta hydrolase [Candidatus Thioglobus sp.]
MERTIPIDPILEKGYNVRLLVDDFDGLIEKWSKWSEDFRANADSSLNCQYGDGEKDKLDIFRCGKPNAPLFIFIHGGYWQRGDKSIYSFVANSFVNSGIDVALIGYQLCPGASMTNIVDKIREAIVWIWNNADEYSISKNRINVSGHSAGGHITGMILATDWKEISKNLPDNLVKTGIPISGLYQLNPIRETTIADALGLDDAESLALSPHFFEPQTQAPILVTLGGGETPEFHWQTDNFVNKWKGFKTSLDYFAEPDVDHFGVVERLANLESQIFTKVKSFLI